MRSWSGATLQVRPTARSRRLDHVERGSRGQAALLYSAATED